EDLLADGRAIHTILHQLGHLGRRLEHRVLALGLDLGDDALVQAGKRRDLLGHRATALEAVIEADIDANALLPIVHLYRPGSLGRVTIAIAGGHDLGALLAGKRLDGIDGLKRFTRALLTLVAAT